MDTGSQGLELSSVVLPGNQEGGGSEVNWCLYGLVTLVTGGLVNQAIVSG